MKAKVLVAQSCLTLCDPMDYSLPGSSDYRISQARILEGVAITPPGDVPHPGIEPVMQCKQILYYLRHQGFMNYSIVINEHYELNTSIRATYVKMDNPKSNIDVKNCLLSNDIQ